VPDDAIDSRFVAVADPAAGPLPDTRITTVPRSEVAAVNLPLQDV
jgi:hypothetical protein